MQEVLTVLFIVFFGLLIIYTFKYCDWYHDQVITHLKDCNKYYWHLVISNIKYKNTKIARDFAYKSSDKIYKHIILAMFSKNVIKNKYINLIEKMYSEEEKWKDLNLNVLEHNLEKIRTFYLKMKKKLEEKELIKLDNYIYENLYPYISDKEVFLNLLNRIENIYE
jgi:hypothetical protein